MRRPRRQRPWKVPYQLGRCRHRARGGRARREDPLTAVESARGLFREAQRRHAAHDVAGSEALALRALDLDPEYVEALEHLAMIYVSRRRRFDEGLTLIERAASLRPDDAGLWYSLGWCCEFAAHERRRRPAKTGIEPRALYEHAAEAFRACLALNPGGKLADDAADLLDHVENELRSL